MSLQSAKKTVRYYYWLIKTFIKKHVKLITLSFFTAFVFILTVISLAPYIDIFYAKKRVVGMAGKYDFNNLPDEIINKISNGLIYINEKGEIIPVLASTWEVRNKGKIYRFHLRNNLIWDDEKNFFAQDINYRFKDIKYRVVDNKTIDFYLDKPLAIFPTYLTKPIIKYPLIGVGGLYHVNKIKEKYGNIIEISLEPNKKGLLPIVYKMYNNESLVIAAYKKGEINEFSITKKTIAENFSQWKNTQIIKSIDYSQLMTLFINNISEFLKEKDVRNAIVAAIDQSKFTDRGEIANGPIKPVSWAYYPDLKKNVYNPSLAEKIFKKDIDASKSAQFNMLTYYDYYDIADEIVNQLKQAGLNINLTLASTDKQGSFDFFLALWKVPQDPDQYYFWHSTQTVGNISNYKNVKVDKLLEDGRKNSIYVNERQKVYFEFQKVIQDDPPAVFLFYPYIYTIKRK